MKHLPKMLVCLMTLGAAMAAQAQAPADERVRTEEYALNLGGDAGSFTDFQRVGIKGFRGLETQVIVDAVYGKKSDRWDSIGRINLETTDGAAQKHMLSFFFYVDRTTRRVTVKHRIDDGELMVVDLTYPLKEPIPFSVAWKSPGVLAVSSGGAMYDVDCGFDVARIRVVGSGVDVRFAPFVLKLAD